ncbi:MAG: LysE family transporter [Cellulomonas sp.]|nr:LysE family transporter [Rickettsiella sp.]
MHFIISGILLGLGAAIPIGPVNLEIARRNLQLGFSYGIFTGIGAVAADLLYLCILSVGALQLLQHSTVLYWINLLGSAILAWFGIHALRASKLIHPSTKLKRKPLKYYCITGFIMTLINPYTILFWASVSARAAAITQQHSGAAMLSGTGVIIGTLSWIIFFNSVLHWSRHYLSSNVKRILNIAGGIILLSFAVLGFLKI